MRNLLVVEDESIVRMGLRYMLQWESHGIHWKAEAANGEEALRIIETERIHIVITDIRMPGMDGLELAKRIKEKDKDIQIIILSSYDNFAYAKEAIRLGAADYLHKPTMDEEELAGSLQKVLEILDQKPGDEPVVSEEDRNECFLSLLDVYTFPEKPVIPELERNEFQEGYWLTVFRRREDALQEQEDEGHLRFLSIHYLIDEYVSKDWGGVVFHRHYREIIWIAPAAMKSGSPGYSQRQKYLEHLRQKILELLNAAVICSDSSLYLQLKQLPDAYMETLLKLPVHIQSDNHIVRKSKEFIDKHLLLDLTLTKVAAAIHVSPGYLSRIFLKEIGENFSDYIIRNKIEYSQKLLRETNRKVYEIAADIGYTNPHYFSKLFKERVGMTPLEYRNQ